MVDAQVDLFFYSFVLSVLISFIGAYFSIIGWRRLALMAGKDSGHLIGARSFLHANEMTLTFQMLYMTAMSYTILLVLLGLDYVIQGHVVVRYFVALFAVFTSVMFAYAFRTYWDIIEGTHVKRSKKK